MKVSLAQQIELKRRQLASAPPHSRRRHQLYFQLRELIVQELRKEIRMDRKRAA